MWMNKGRGIQTGPVGRFGEERRGRHERGQKEKS